MHDVNHAIATLRDLSGLETLEFDANGNISLVFNDETDINIARIDDKTIEIWTEVDSLGAMDDRAMLRWLLEANYLGRGAGSARIALAPDKDAPVLCERIGVEPLTGDQLSERILVFLKYAAFWNSAEGARAALVESSELTSIPADDFTIRA